MSDRRSRVYPARSELQGQHPILVAAAWLHMTPVQVIEHGHHFPKLARRHLFFLHSVPRLALVLTTPGALLLPGHRPLFVSPDL